MSDKSNVLGKNISRLRQERSGLSREDFAEANNIKYSALREIEQGVVESPRIDMLKKISTPLQVPISELYRDPESKYSPKQDLFFEITSILIGFNQDQLVQALDFVRRLAGRKAPATSGAKGTGSLT